MRVLNCRPAGEPASEIRIGRGISSQLIEWAKDRNVFALVDPAVADSAALSQQWRRHTALVGDDQKTLAACEIVLRAMVGAGLDRDGLMIAFGGGAVGDAGGFCASVFMRGIELWQVPTTLLSMVDSSVGGKTAVNLPAGKNLVGTVHPARFVIIDVDFVTSLPETQFLSGLAEAVKMGIGVDRELFELLERERDAVRRREPAVLLEVIERSIAAKIAIVEGDLHETGRRRLLNLGHTLGHALEASMMGRAPHGLCVARGLHFALELARNRGALSASDFDRCFELLNGYGFDRETLPPVGKLMGFMAHDKKVRGDVVQFALPTGIGQSSVEAIELDSIRAQLES